MLDGFWACVDRHNLPRNPYRAGFLQFVGVADSDAEAERLYGEHAKYFYRNCLHVAPGYVNPPGYTSIATIRAGIQSQIARIAGRANARAEIATLTWKDFVDRGYVVAGSPDTVVEKLTELGDKLNVGHLMVLLHFGNMPRETTIYNTTRFAEEIMPRLRARFGEWEDKWWPKDEIAEPARPQPVAVA